MGGFIVCHATGSETGHRPRYSRPGINLTIRERLRMDIIFAGPVPAAGRSRTKCRVLAMTRRTPLNRAYEGKADEQAEAIWHYCIG